jgi:hypothetical protein
VDQLEASPSGPDEASLDNASSSGARRPSDRAGSSKPTTGFNSRPSAAGATACRHDWPAGATRTPGSWVPCRSCAARSRAPYATTWEVGRGPRPRELAHRPDGLRGSATSSGSGRADETPRRLPSLSACRHASAPCSGAPSLGRSSTGPCSPDRRWWRCTSGAVGRRGGQSLGFDECTDRARGTPQRRSTGQPGSPSRSETVSRARSPRGRPSTDAPSVALRIEARSLW